MPFKKLHPTIKEFIENQEITIPTPFQKASIPAIKSGANIFCIAPAGSGKTIALILTTMQKLKCEETGTAPRAIVIVENNEKAQQLYALFIKYTRPTSLRVYFGDERAHIDLLKSEIFEGVDILVSSPKTINKLILAEGLNTTQVKLFSIDDADFLVQKSSSADLIAVTQSIQKCQFVMYAEKMHPTLKRFEAYFMYPYKTVAI
ncbi:MAG: DEAD/DEAH box helicase [Polaribacter sp.]|mgnify:FL=1|jgi:superfamily II DNA/RNA helicase|nr:DEAD/DEAH box helicase [Polaribacter sp.]MDG1246431.1 DEAD/DEAH box helicase [Polaribacter sp.]MDG1320603.1 DEAD/DEAH box helicase [Polaribacter sp.]